MPTTSDASPWATAVRQRRKALLQRLGMGAAAAFVFSPVLTWDFAALWVAGYFVVQLLDLWVFGPVNSGKVDRMGPVRMLAANVMLVANALYFGSLSVALWFTGGPMGGICAAMLLSSGAIYAVVNAPRSNLVLALSIAPQFLYLAATPFFMLAWGAPPAFCTAVATGIAVFITYCLSVWRQMERARNAEAAARLEADRKRVEAEAAMNSRSAFLAAVGHDLRTPIGAIMSGAMEIERAADGASRSQARLIADAGLMMKALLDDLLDHAKLEAGRMTVDAVDFDLRALTAQTLKLWQQPVRAKGLSLRLEGAASLPRAVRGDPMRLRQILNNLISNAVKFTQTGSVTLRLSAWEEDGGLHSVVFEIADTGPGMTAEQVARLFTPFDQTADGVQARHGGTGLGLAISRELVGLMGGRLTVRSRPGEGAAFTVAVTFAPAASDVLAPAAPDETGRRVVAQALKAPAPAEPVVAAAPAADEPAADEPPPEAEDEGRAMKVLVVDDHDINRRAVQLILAPLGVEVTTAEDGMAALRACDQGEFDMIFMDVRMPELDGRETTRRLRASGGPNARVPVIAVTADTSPEDIEACLAAGMSYFVPKPITPPALLGAVQHVLSGLSAEAEAPAETVAA
ncbi:ATP-binding protein [Brevundimonas fluminis]|jgi:signal transduction histidine kinase/ActR/RegA family two-component response regulator|uniref:ATP-binding protein n=1 Tax=Brevundimonas fluminis TaxID=2487274 RepID=UPI0013DE74B5|nr:ATP-binding protein [Brevundimonas fluminis]